MGPTITPFGSKILSQATRIVECLRTEDEAPLSRQEVEAIQRNLSRLLSSPTNEL
ncbi:hypothetical protein [Alcaligenes aquatilis]|uniref:hypothetical protein n=1 Tax=Alcaligenes aquatilis TaxID=323284 RepID=UPI0013CEF8E4|nr:hypothetical protein [Alcaligenes aquatilis]